MKNLTYLICLISFTAFGQDAKYMSAMEKNVAIVDSAMELSTLMDVSNSFERIAMANPKEWLPLYYQSYCQVMIGMRQQENSAKDERFDKAKELVVKAESLSPDNSEILVLKSFITGMIISVDPMTRGQKLGMESTMSIEKAISLDKENPRAYLIKGSGLMYRPAQFGGGKDAALPVLEQAVSKFETFKPANKIMPHWGSERATYMLEQCKKME